MCLKDQTGEAMGRGARWRRNIERPGERAVEMRGEGSTGQSGGERTALCQIPSHLPSQRQRPVPVSLKSHPPRFLSDVLPCLAVPSSPLLPFPFDSLPPHLPTNPPTSPPATCQPAHQTPGGGGNTRAGERGSGGSLQRALAAAPARAVTEKHRIRQIWRDGACTLPCMCFVAHTVQWTGDGCVSRTDSVRSNSNKTSTKQRHRHHPLCWVWMDHRQIITS